MHTKSIWNEFASMHSYPSLDNDITADVAIIGGGITGVSTAHLLAQNGMKVVVLEQMKVGGGTTSHSTGNLYSTVDKNLSQFHNKYDTEVIKKIVASRSAALDQIEAWVDKYNLDCDFKRQPWTMYSHKKENDHLIEKEHKYALDAGLQAEWLTSPGFPLSVSKAVEVKNQAQVNPMRYVQELAHAVRSENLRVADASFLVRATLFSSPSASIRSSATFCARISDTGGVNGTSCFSQLLTHRRRSRL